MVNMVSDAFEGKPGEKQGPVETLEYKLAFDPARRLAGKALVANPPAFSCAPHNAPGTEQFVEESCAEKLEGWGLGRINRGGVATLGVVEAGVDSQEEGFVSGVRLAGEPSGSLNTVVGTPSVLIRL